METIVIKRLYLRLNSNCVDPKTRRTLAMLMGVIIAVADLYWTYTSMYYTQWLLLGVIIFAADLVWICLDLKRMR